MCLVTQSCPTLCDLINCSPPGSSVHGDSPGKNPGVGCHALLQGIFPTQGSNPGLPHCRWILYHLSHQGSSTTLMVLQVNSHLSLQIRAWLVDAFILICISSLHNWKTAFALISAAKFVLLATIKVENPYTGWISKWKYINKCKTTH